MASETTLTNFTINYLTQAQFDALTTKEANEFYLTPDSSITDISAGTGLSGGGSSGAITINHSNSVSAKTTQAFYPIAFDAQGHITSAGTAITPLTEHYTTHLYVGTSSGSANAATSNGSTYLMVLDNSTVRDRRKISGTQNVSVSSDSSGNITITGPDLSPYLTAHNSYNVSTTGNGNAVTAVSLSGTTFTVTKGSTFLTSHQDISGKADKSATVSTVEYDSTNAKITKTINGTKSDVVTVATLKSALGSMPASDVYSWAKASSKPTYTASEVGALPSNHTYTTSIATSSATNQITLAHGTKYAITAGGTSYVFTMPADNNTTYSAGTGLSLSGTTFSVKLGYSTSGNNRAVQADSNGNLYVVQTDTDTNTTYSAGTGLSLSGTTFNVKLGYTTSGNNRAVKADSSGNLYVEQKDDNTTYTFSTSNPTLSWGTTSTIGTAGGTTYKVTMPANPNTDTKLQVAEVSSNTIYYPIVGSGTTAATRQYDTTGLSYSTTTGTTSAQGLSSLTLGNSTASGTAGNKLGELNIYGSGSRYVSLRANVTATSGNNFTIYLPNQNGTIALTSDIPTSLPASDVYSWAKASSKPSYTASEVGALSSSTTYVSTITTSAGSHSTISSKSGAVSFNVPTKTSHLTNDSGFITSYTDTQVTQTPLNGTNSGRNVLLSYSLSNSGSTAADTNGVYKATYMTYNDYSPSLTLTSRSDSSKVASFTSSGFNVKTGNYSVSLNANTQTANHTVNLPDKAGTIALTSDIPTSLPASDVYSWAKASSKPSYTASEVGALSSSTTYVSTITTSAGSHSTISSKSGAVSFNVPTKTSHLTNDSGFITSYTDTKDTTGSSNKTGTKMYLVAATSQSSNITTYSNSNCYVGTDNCLYSGGSKVLTSHQTAVTSLTTTAGAHSTKSSATGAVSMAVPTKTSHLTNDSSFTTLQAVYPVGAIYISTVSTDPHDLFGFGTWDPIGGQFLLGANSTYTAGKTGGSPYLQEHTHTMSHTHTMAHTHGTGVDAAPYFLATVTAGSAGDMGTVSGSGRHYFYQSTTSSGTYWSHPQNTGGSSAANTGAASNATTSNHNQTTGNTDQGNMPPYLAVYMWKRTA